MEKKKTKFHIFQNKMNPKIPAPGPNFFPQPSRNLSHETSLSPPPPRPLAAQVLLMHGLRILPREVPDGTRAAVIGRLEDVVASAESRRAQRSRVDWERRRMEARCGSAVNGIRMRGFTWILQSYVAEFCISGGA